MVIIINILHICSYYYGTKLYKNLMDNIITNDIGTMVFAPCANTYNYNGNEEYLIKAKCFNKIDRLFFSYKYKKVYSYLIKNIDFKKFELTHAHSLFSNGYISYRLYKEYNIPYIVAVRNTDINTFFKYMIHLRKLGMEIIKNAKKIIFISEAYIDRLMDYLPKEDIEAVKKKSVVIPNGIDNIFLMQDNIEKKLNKTEINLVYTGRVDSNKNLITTIRCCKRILNHKYNVKLNVIGTIVSLKYKKIFSKNGFINYYGQKNKEEIIDIYKNMDIFVMPSKHETFGLTYVEAMSQGLPVIYTKNEGFDKFFPDGEVGYPIKYNDYKEMANKIEGIISNYAYISHNCKKNAQRFNWPDIAKKYVSIYEGIKE